MENSIDDAYKKGAEDAWKAAKKIVLTEALGGYTADELQEIFGICGFRDVIEAVDCLEAIKEIRRYEEQKKILKSATRLKGTGIKQ